MEVEITYRSIPLRIEGTYEAGEEQVRYYSDMTGYPGSNSSFDVNEIYATDSDVDIYEIFGEKEIEEIETEVINKIEER